MRQKRYRGKLCSVHFNYNYHRAIFNQPKNTIREPTPQTHRKFDEQNVITWNSLQTFHYQGIRPENLWWVGGWYQSTKSWIFQRNSLIKDSVPSHRENRQNICFDFVKIQIFVPVKKFSGNIYSWSLTWGTVAISIFDIPQNNKFWNHLVMARHAIFKDANLAPGSGVTINPNLESPPPFGDNLRTRGQRWVDSKIYQNRENF